jgi:hypothetical protein
MNCHELIYGPIGCTSRFLTFAHQSNIPLAIHGEVDRFFAQAINEVKVTGDGKLLVVMNGWDGLTTDLGSFLSIFRTNATRITIRVFAESPRSFFQVNVEQAIKVLDGTIRINPYVEEMMPTENFDQETQNCFRDAEALLEHSTARFCREFNSIHAIKMDWSSVKYRLQAASHQRNTDPAMARNLEKWKCPEPGCGKTFPEYHVYYAHRRVHLGQTIKFSCDFCERTFTRDDARNHHQKMTCAKRPGHEIEEHARKKPKAALRGSRPIKPTKGMPRSSDGSVDYYQLSETQIRSLPRLETDPHVAASLSLINKRCDLIYKGEIYCRWPGCKTVTKYSSPSKLRLHYKNAHKYEYPHYSSGVLEERSQKEHVGGLLWLTKAALHGKENAGEKP